VVESPLQTTPALRANPSSLSKEEGEIPQLQPDGYSMAQERERYLQH